MSAPISRRFGNPLKAFFEIGLELWFQLIEILWQDDIGRWGPEIA